MTKPRDPRRVVLWIVAGLIAAFGGSAVFTDRDPLNPYWITLFTAVLGITVATTGNGNSDDPDNPAASWFERIRQRTEKVVESTDNERSRNDRRANHHRRIRPRRMAV